MVLYRHLLKKEASPVIRNAKTEDLETIQTIYARARRFMEANGNPTQWAGGYPQEDTLRKDIDQGSLFVIEEGGAIHGVFALIIGEDPAYGYIEGGCWRSDGEYGTIHRVAGDGMIHGVLEKAVTFSLEKIRHLRIDTHADNHVMQYLIRKCGFQECGVIYQPDGTARTAFERI